jgi:hypothetical protein
MPPLDGPEMEARGLARGEPCLHLAVGWFRHSGVVGYDLGVEGNRGPSA